MIVLAMAKVFGYALQAMSWVYLMDSDMYMHLEQ